MIFEVTSRVGFVARKMATYIVLCFCTITETDGRQTDRGCGWVEQED